MKTLIAFIIMLAAGAGAAFGKDEALSAKTQYADVAGVKIAYRSIGAGEPIIMVNRLRGTIDTWDPKFVDALAKERRVIIFDYPGVGYSQGQLPPDMHKVSDTTADFARAIGVGKFDLVGWSWGGALAQTFLVEHPDMVKRAVLIGTNPPGKNELPIQKEWFERAVKPINDLADEEILFFEPKSKASLEAASRSHDRIYARSGVTEHIPSTMEEFKLFFAAAQGYKDDKQNVRGRLAASTIPMLILCGDNDPSVPAENWYPLVGRIPNAQLIVLPQSGHGPQHQYPDLSAAYILSFLDDATQ